MEETKKYEPLRLKPCLRSYLWGGTRLRGEYHKTGEGVIAESWELSVRADGQTYIDSGEHCGESLADVLRADPAGNITLFVLDPIERERRAALAAELMRRLPDMKIDQVGFACPADADTDGRMEMMGGEFCGNATRAYAMYVARQRGGLSEVRLRVSGCDHVVTAAVDLARGAARAEMPLPRAVRAAEVEGHAGTLVDLAGIAHLVIEGVAPSEDFFRAAEPLFSAIEGLDAYGVIFLDRTSHRMTPLVKVVDTGTLIWEGSCGSGTIACAVAESAGLADGLFEQDYFQPAGVVRASIERRGGAVVSAAIGGPVTLDEPVCITL